MMNMQHIKDSIVGDGMHKGISGGQLKRLSIAVEIVPLPRLIFLGIFLINFSFFCAFNGIIPNEKMSRLLGWTVPSPSK